MLEQSARERQPATTQPETTQPATTQPQPETTQPPTTQPQTTQPETTQPVNDDADLIAKLKERGINVDKLDDLKKPIHKEPTEEEKKEADKKKKEEALKYGLDQKLYSKEDYDSYVLDAAKPATDIAFQLFKDNFLAEIKGTSEEGSFTDEDIKEEFNQAYNLTANEDSAKRKLGEKAIQKVADSYLKDKYGKILSVDDKYTSFQTELVKAGQYKEVVDKAFGSLPEKITYKVDGIDVDFKLTPEIVDQVKAVYYDPKAYRAFGKEATAENLVQAIQKTISTTALEQLITEVAQGYHATQLANLKLGRQGILPERDNGTAGSGSGGTKHADAMLDNTKGK
jgi:hypothetical protein